AGVQVALRRRLGDQDQGGAGDEAGRPHDPRAVPEADRLGGALREAGMNVLVSPPLVPESPQRIVLNRVSWRDYENFLEAMACQNIRSTYDRGVLEIMSPLPLHETLKHLFGMLFLALGEEFDLMIRGLGSSTFRKEAAGRGLEPDECYYLASWPRVRDWRHIDLAVDPPPDLALEVDITTNWLDRRQ